MADNDPNKLFLAKLGQQKPKLVINLSKADEEDSGPADTLSNRRRHLGTTYRRRPGDDIIGRKKDKVIVNFWDLGQLADGTDINFQIDPTAVVPGSYGFDPVFTPVFNSLSPAGWTQLTDLIYGVSMDDWSTHFHKLGYEEAEEYGLDVYFGGNFYEADKYFPVGRNGSRLQIREFMTGGSPVTIAGTKWTEDGLVVPSGLHHFSVSSVLGFVNTHMYASDALNTYITATNDPNADPVTPTWSGHVNVYLVPMIVFESAFAADNTNPATRRVVNGFYTTMPREFYLGRYLNFTQFATETATAFCCPAFLSDDERQQTLHTDLTDFMKTRTGARVFDFHSGSSLALSAFPFGSALYTAGHTSQSAGQYPANNTIIYNQTPVAVIRNGGSWYWVWNATDPPRVGWSSMFTMLPL